ncbi:MULTISPECIES: hypothetical protein [Cupriavidus]|uniref:hypothetical protein n=1 Tax=Cupriavidus TaxID=106589 RepID=UPI000CDFF5CF|nr:MULTISPECIES: hypothetical protein [Cupriavidus]AVA33697.1 hypothetical protein C3Z06_08640 [Cupriavidus metallidurans]KAB0594534.1 hypothetical protein F7R19_29315 [Cupriavidus pauculus]UAL03920.1 hypothetical protein K8O84_29245 [Cupriavidus pauculus]
MKLILDAAPTWNETEGLESTLLTLQKLGFLVAHQRRMDGSFVVEVEDEIMKEFSRIDLWAGFLGAR